MKLKPKEKEKLCKTLDKMYESSSGTSWQKVCEDLQIERISKLMSIIIDAEDDEVRVDDPTGMVLRIPSEVAWKIIVLG